MTLINATPEAPIEIRIDESQITHAPLSEDRRAGRQRRLVAAILSILTNVLLILAIIITLPPLPTPMPKPISVKIVPPSAVPHPEPRAAEPKPRPKSPAPKPPHPKPAPKQQHLGNIASENIGDPNAPKDSTQSSQTPAAGPAMQQEGSAQPAPTTKAAIVEKTKPTQIRGRIPTEKRGGAKVRAIIAPPHHARLYAKIPGPDATEDQYLAYINGQLNSCVSPALVAEVNLVGREPELSFTVRRSGAIVWVNLDKSSGSATLDREFQEVFDCAGRFPPLPDYLSGPTVVFSWPGPRD